MSASIQRHRRGHQRAQMRLEIDQHWLAPPCQDVAAVAHERCNSPVVHLLQQTFRATKNSPSALDVVGARRDETVSQSRASTRKGRGTPSGLHAQQRSQLRAIRATGTCGRGMHAARSGTTQVWPPCSTRYRTLGAPAQQPRITAGERLTAEAAKRGAWGGVDGLGKITVRATGAGPLGHMIARPRLDAQRSIRRPIVIRGQVASSFRGSLNPVSLRPAAPAQLLPMFLQRLRTSGCRPLRRGQPFEDGSRRMWVRNAGCGRRRCRPRRTSSGLEEGPIWLAMCTSLTLPWPSGIDPLALLQQILLLVIRAG